VSSAQITTDVPTDFADRPRPVGAAYDLGAFEFQNSSAGGSSGTAASSSGGAAASGNTAIGGKAAVGGSTSAGGSAVTGGKATNSGGTAVAGGNFSVGGSPNTNAANNGGALQNSVGGAAQATGGVFTPPSSTTGNSPGQAAGCSCRYAGIFSNPSLPSLIGLLAMALGITRVRNRRASNLRRLTLARRPQANLCSRSR